MANLNFNSQLDMTSEQILVVLVTVPNKDVGSELAHKLIDSQLAACVNIVPALTSVYRWKGKVETAEECLLIIKTVSDRFSALEKKIISEHPYQTPEIVGLPTHSVFEDYAQWVAAETRVKQ